MTSFWISLLFKLAMVSVVAFAAGALRGAIVGWVVACGGLVVLLVFHMRNLARLAHWLHGIERAPESREVPDAWGDWGNVFAGIYRLMRYEAKKRDDVARELELFVQAGQALPDGVVLLDRGDQLLWCNRTAQAHLGLRGEEDYGLRITNIVRAPRLAEFISRAESKQAFRYNPLHNPDQLLSIETVPFGDGRKMLVSFDITQIERADTTRRDFIANVSHELRTPLTVIHGFLEHMNEDTAAASEQTRRHMRLMTQQSDRMLKLVDDLLTLSRLEGGDHPPREERVDMAALLNTLAEDARALSDGRHRVAVDAAPAHLKGSRDELRSAFGNLVSNAVRYTPAGGAITLRWQQNADHRGVFSVSDTGIGIAAEHIPRLTERFYRVDRGRSRETGGTGLGLAIVKHVLIRHQATLDIQSELGKGSTFRVVFPAWRSVMAEQPVAEEVA